MSTDTGISLNLGFNVEKVKEAGKSLQQNADDAISNIITAVETSIVSPVSTFWVAEEAVTYFQKFKEYVDQIPYAVYAYFDRFRQELERAAQTWLRNTGDSYYNDESIPAEQRTFITPISANGEVIQLNVSSIIPVTTTGDRGANTAELDSFIASLETTKETIISAISVGNLSELESAFIGGTQAVDASSAYTRIIDLVGKIFDFLTVDDPSNGTQSLKSAMEAVEEKYGAVSTDVSTGFTNTFSNSASSTPEA